MLSFFNTLPHSVARSFLHKRIYFHIVAIILTAIIVFSGTDWNYYLMTRSSMLEIIALPAVFLGLVLPVIVPLIILWWGHIKRSRATISLAWALGQAAFAGWLISSAYKALTGRLPPSMRSTLVDTSHSFNFGLFKEGIFWGWPSSHTTVAFAVSIAFMRLRPKYRILGFLALFYAFYVGLGVSITIHWFSEFVAGALIGTAVGFAVSDSFKQKSLHEKNT